MRGAQPMSEASALAAANVLGLALPTFSSNLDRDKLEWDRVKHAFQSQCKSMLTPTPPAWSESKPILQTAEWGDY